MRRPADRGPRWRHSAARAALLCTTPATATADGGRVGLVRARQTADTDRARRPAAGRGARGWALRGRETTPRAGVGRLTLCAG